ncbi:MAG: TRAP transporter small permease [Lachnospiraceae bacterium]|nr:TRAP transporter small permease [Lachnospiraceae bacterium]
MERKRKETPFNKPFDIIEKVELAFGGATLAILFVIVLLQIVSRLLNIKLTWSEEATRFFFLWMMWISVGTGFNHCESSRVTVFVNMMPKVVQKICHALYYIASGALFLVMVVVGWQNAMQQLAMGEMGSAFRVPMWLVGIAVPIGAAIGILGLVNTGLTESWRLTTTAEQLEADALVEKAKAEFAEENTQKEGGDEQ